MLYLKAGSDPAFFTVCVTKEDNGSDVAEKMETQTKL